MALKINNLFILKSSLYPHGVLRIHVKLIKYARKKNRYQRLPLHHHDVIRISIRNYIIQSKNAHFTVGYTDIKKEIFTEVFNRASYIHRTPDTVTPSTAYLFMFGYAAVYVSLSILIF